MKNAKDFKTIKDFFRYLQANKAEIAEMRKSTRKFTDAFGVSPIQAKANKALNTSYIDDETSGEIRRTVILNTYNWLDGHDDVHLNGVFSDSLKGRQDKIWHLHDHQYQLTAKVGKPVRIYEKNVPWTDLGVDQPGETQALFMESDLQKGWNEKIFQMYKSGDIQQHSVGMRYDTLKLAINDPEMKEEYAVWKAHIDSIGNKEAAMKQGFFWAVSKADLYEGSCVLEGSNELTPAIPNGEGKTIEPPVQESFYDRMMKAFTV